MDNPKTRSTFGTTQTTKTKKILQHIPRIARKLGYFKLKYVSLLPRRSNLQTSDMLVIYILYTIITDNNLCFIPRITRKLTYFELKYWSLLPRHSELQTSDMLVLYILYTIITDINCALVMTSSNIH